MLFNHISLCEASNPIRMHILIGTTHHAYYRITVDQSSTTRVQSLTPVLGLEGQVATCGYHWNVETDMEQEQSRIIVLDDGYACININ